MIITLCGSAKFEKQYLLYNKVLTLAGHCVFGLGTYPSNELGILPYNEYTKQWYNPAQKLMLDNVHKMKIIHSHAIVFLNVNAYMGKSTLSELVWAKMNDKDIYFLESWGNGINDSPVDTTGEKGIITHSDLLGRAGPLRSSLIDMIKQAEEE